MERLSAIRVFLIDETLTFAESPYESLPTRREIFTFNFFTEYGNMKIVVITLLTGLILAGPGLYAQTTELPEDKITAAQLKADIYWFASDYLAGRNTGKPGNDIAAQFLATQIEAADFKPAPGQDSYLQTIDFEVNTPPQEGHLTINKNSYSYKEDFIFLTGKSAKLEKAKAVYAGYGMEEDYAGLDVAGKVVFVMGGDPESRSNQATFDAIPKKRKIAEAKGAAALIEIYNLSFPWNFFVQYFGRENLSLPSADQSSAGRTIVYGWMQPSTEYDDVKILKEGGKAKVSLSSSGFSREITPSSNVVGVLEGSDPELKDEYVLLSAHFDHVGVGAEGGGAYSAADSIFNGTRDNGIGSMAMLATARALGQKPPKRSIIYFACTGEEKGLLGSKYYAENPLIPLEQTVYNLNIDNGGYNDTDLVTIIGFGRTGTDEAVQAASQKYGLKAISDPAPEQGLFDRSDNVSFAVKGIPCLSFSMGFTAFDSEIMKYYHQVTDNPDNVDYNYIQKYAQAYANLARRIANMETLPFWKEGDKYEEAGKALYNK